jgi:excisionase family DNA binding protein
MTKSEAQTRSELIDQQLAQSGWNVKGQTQVVEEFDILTALPPGVAEPRTPYEGHQFSDYVLLGKGAAMADPEGEILTLEEVAAYLKAGKRTVYRLAQDGKIPAFKLGGSWRFRRAELDRWIAASIENPQKQGER